MWQQIEHFLEIGSAWAWATPTILLLCGTHIFLTVRLRFVQTYIGKAIRLSLERTREGEGEISHFGALMTALAATIGTGNIVGVATAIALGGPGAVFWIWLTGVFGIATKYGEAVLAVKYRVVRPDGSVAGGPMYALEHGLKCKWLALAFAVFTAIAAFGIGNGVQANAISSVLQDSFGLSRWISGVFLTAMTGVVLLGGVRSIARVCSALVPFMALFYIIGCLAIIIFRMEHIPETLWLILSSAFNGQAAVGGFVGAGMREAMRYGVARGLFSNESGLGSAPIVAAAAQTQNPVRQGLVSASGTFWDTVVICALTGIVLVDSGSWKEGLDGANLTKAAFGQLGVAGETLLLVSLFTFVFSTILGWSYYGEKAIEYLFGGRAIKPYRLLWVAMVMTGAVANLTAVWNFADIANALMAIPNLIALLLLSPVIVAESKKYLWEKPASPQD